MSNLIFFIFLLVGFVIFYVLGICIDNWWTKIYLKEGLNITDKARTDHLGYLICIYLVGSSIISAVLRCYNLIG